MIKVLYLTPEQVKKVSNGHYYVINREIRLKVIEAEVVVVVDSSNVTVIKSRIDSKYN